MAHISIGATGMLAEQNGFGALPVQRVPLDDAVKILRRAYDGGFTYFDTARGYTDSEEKLGAAFATSREKIIIATKTPSRSASQFWADLETSLRTLKTDYIDVYQFHNPAVLPRPGDENGLYDAMLEAKAQGKIRHIGVTNHRLSVAEEAVASGLYETLQFPFSYLATEREIALVESCKAKNMGFIAMKALSGGLITNANAACAWITRFDNVIPIWGIQRERELDEFLACIASPPALDAALQEEIDRDRRELGGEFCRGCGYCMPCPQGIQIDTCARASLLLRRAPSSMLLSDNGGAMMAKVADCIDCRECVKKCPYGLDTPALLKRNYRDYLEVLDGKAL